MPPEREGSPMFSRERLHLASRAAASELLGQQNEAGFWEGELSSSALSTATAIVALSLVQRAAPSRHLKTDEQIEGGFRWLAANQNEDGGWGDTNRSFSNISTTALVWGAFAFCPSPQSNAATARAERWLIEAIGGSTLVVSNLVRSIEHRYGKDKTFSIPILTMLALCGRLGKGTAGWARVRALPFELAAFPRRWFAALRLPVVSYALPALIAIGQARHFHLPAKNLFTRLVRNRTTWPTLKILEEIQPESGGFLEATPLTSFVVMSLAGSAQALNPVCQRGAQFLVRSQRLDGSWPIDTNLATWVTTLAIHALGNLDNAPDEGKNTAAWLLRQQDKSTHIYTMAPPGGWAWTDLSGGVPDADDTAGALIALRALEPTALAPAWAGAAWLLQLQNRDGGIPTFCRGWGTLPFDRSAPDLTAHALRAWSAWFDSFSTSRQKQIRRGMKRALRYLDSCQQSDGAFFPLWFGNQHNSKEENPVYGTSRVVLALAELQRGEIDPHISGEGQRLCHLILQKASGYLVAQQRPGGGWGGSKGPCSIEESSLAVEALAATRDPKWRTSCERGIEWLIEKVDSGQWRQPAPIGFYFAKLWYWEKLYPLIFTVSALRKAEALEWTLNNND